MKDLLYSHLSVNEKSHLTIEGHDAADLIKEYGSPLMVISESVIRENCRTYMDAIRKYFPEGSRALFAGKSLCIRAMYPIIDSEDMGADVASDGELYTALKAGFPAEKLFFHGNNKTDENITFAVESAIGYIVCDNEDELMAIDRIARDHGTVQKILLRLTPGIDPHTQEKINTGRIDSKFGSTIATGQAEELTLKALKLENIALKGFHCHIGSQIFEADPFEDAARMMCEFIALINEKTGFQPEFLNLGGGFGVPYVASDSQVDYTGNIEKVGAALNDACGKLNINVPKILLEPGRSIVAKAGTTIYTAGAVKYIPGYINYVSVDGGMTDNPRYTLYESAYTVVAADRMNDECTVEYTVAGRCCESGDLLQRNVMLPEMHRGDLIAVLTTGAYNYAMASNYNRVRRPAIAMVTKDASRLAVKRESFEDLVINDL